jgi:hypothetical protein
MCQTLPLSDTLKSFGLAADALGAATSAAAAIATPSVLAPCRGMGQSCVTVLGQY